MFDITAFESDETTFSSTIVAPMYICDLWGCAIHAPNRPELVVPPKIAVDPAIQKAAPQSALALNEIALTLYTRLVEQDGFDPQIAARALPLSTLFMLHQTGFIHELMNDIILLQSFERIPNFEFLLDLGNAFLDKLGVML